MSTFKSTGNRDLDAVLRLREAEAEALLADLRETAELVDRLVTVLVQKGLIDRRELDAAAEKFRQAAKT